MNALTPAVIRAEAEWLIDRDPIRAQRLYQAAVFMDEGAAFNEKARALLATVTPASIDRPIGRADHVQSSNE